MKAAEIRVRLREMAEPRYAAFAGGLLPDNRHPLLGVRLPRLRQLARELANADGARALLRRTPGKRAAFEEIMLRGFVAGYAPGLDFAERCACIDRLVPFLDNWSLCDSCCATYRFVRLQREAAWEWLLPYTRSAGEYARRFGIVMLLDHFIQDPAWAPRVARLLPAITPGAYYSDMAVAWCACELCPPVAFANLPRAGGCPRATPPRNPILRAGRISAKGRISRRPRRSLVEDGSKRFFAVMPWGSIYTKIPLQ